MEWEREESWFIMVAPVERFLSPTCTHMANTAKRKSEGDLTMPMGMTSFLRSTFQSSGFNADTLRHDAKRLTCFHEF
eukprot:1157921-Pelagomonas_calceolata.AAC.3